MTREDRRIRDQPHIPERRHNTPRRMTAQEIALVVAAMVFLLLLVYGISSSTG